MPVFYGANFKQWQVAMLKSPSSIIQSCIAIGPWEM